MFNLNKTIPTPKLWSKKKSQQRRSPFFFLSLFLLSLLFLFFLTFTSIPISLFSSSSSKTTAISLQFPHCEIRISGEKFLWYAPHSGFSNQLSEFKNALLMAGILNRTLIIPPILSHHAIALGSCPKFRVQSPKEIRVSVWDHVIELITSGRYVSMADIIDISSVLSSSHVRAIDSGFLCPRGVCGSLLSGVDGNIDRCLSAVDDDCRTTVWTYGNDEADGVLDSFQPNEQLKKKKKISYVRRRRDVYKTLGPGSKADSATVLAFGTLFTAPYKGSELYIDIQKAPRDSKIQSLIKKIEFLPFVPEILSAGKQFAVQTVKAPFLCAQLRLLDGQFKNHWEATFSGLKQKLDSLSQTGSRPIHVFVMTDLPQGNWTGNYLGDLAKDSTNFKLYFMNKEDLLVTETAKKLALARHGLRSGSSLGGIESTDTVAKLQKHCSPRILPDILLFIEETIRSCGSLGFFGTAGSTIADNIEIMRKFGSCSNQREDHKMM
ncbi:O-fucosyltransferase family protein [Gossypium australe]|uniref:O-fucosyltransferase family protein n=1 Tax=Gossypium australe TaxID=47621 RepID=A0A5B6UL70_9ROSI|nr:O-fucosyltransferase family protein [Gossypium australe]